MSARGAGLPSLTGALSELLVCVDLLSKGWTVYRAIDAQASCDLVAIRNAEVLRVEVKTDGPRIKLNNKRGRFDVLAVVYRDNDIRYVSSEALPDIDTIRPQNVSALVRSTAEALVFTRNPPQQVEITSKSGGFFQ